MKRVFKGWVRKTAAMKDVMFWDRWDNILESSTDIVRYKDTKYAWDEGDWPPRRVTVTVEVEDE